MKTRTFSDIARDPLLVPDKIDGILTYFLSDPNSYELAQYLPLVNVNADKVEMDYVKMRHGGVTPLAAVGAATPIFGGWGRGTREFEPAHFREKVLILEQELVKLRKIGTKAEMETAQNLLQRKTEVIEERLQNRLELMRRQVLFDNEVTAKGPNGAAFTLDYAHPDYMEPTLSGDDLWSDHEKSDPLANLQEWVEDFQVHGGFAVKEIVFPMFLMRHLQANDQFRTALFYNMPQATASVSQILNELVAYVGLSGPNIIRLSTGKINTVTELTAGSAQNDTTLDVADVSTLEVGDSLYVRRVTDNHAEKFEISSISGNTVTVSSGVADTGGFAAGDIVRSYLPTIPLDKILIAGTRQGPVNTVGAEAAPDQEFVSRWGDVCSTLSRYVDFNNPRPGIFTKLIDKMGEDPPRMENVIGVNALPRIHYPDAWMVPTVL